MNKWWKDNWGKTLVIFLMCVFVWHLGVTAVMQGNVNPTVLEKFGGELHVNFITDVVTITASKDVICSDIDETMCVLMVGMANSAINVILKAELASRARGSFDVYAMIVPWTVHVKLE